jgi:hypothetical protein
MRQRLAAIALAASLTVLAPLAVAAQEAMPLDEYLAAVVAFEKIEDSNSSGTLEDMLAGFDVGKARYTAEVERLTAVTAEPCYEAAHEELIAFYEFSLAMLDDMRPMLELRTTMGGIEVRVPHDWSVEVDQEVLAGGLEVDVTPPEQLPADAPKLRIHAVTRMGGGLVTSKSA